MRAPADLLAALEQGVGVWTHPVLAFLLKLVDRTRRRIRDWGAANQT